VVEDAEIPVWTETNPKETKGHPQQIEECPIYNHSKLDHSDICSGRTLLSLLNVKRNLVAFVEGFEPG
jgi:hypothetical protein